MRKKKTDLLCVQKFDQTPRPTAVLVVWRREDTRWVRCTARRTQVSELRLTVSGLAAKRRGECARVNLSIFCVSQCDCLLLLYSSVVYEYVSTERRVPSALLLVSRPEPAPADCSLATERRADRASGAEQRRYTAVSPSNSSIVQLL